MLDRVCGRALMLAVVLMLGAAATGDAFAQQKPKLRVVYVGVVTWLPAMIAKDDGLFEKNGLDVEMTKVAEAYQAAVAKRQTVEARARELKDELASARAEVERMCDQLLANPLIESYEIEIAADD